MPSTALEGLVTTSGWTIGKMINKSSGSGGNFCTRYTAKSECGKIGFLKAMDLSKVASKSLVEMQRTIEEYLFEQNILEQCKEKKLSKVVVPLDSGEIETDINFPPLNRVFYIIFDLADGDLREQFINPDIISWKDLFKSLHHVAIGIRQLHQIGVIHQDIKPSNVLCFPDNESKISDLGRVTDIKGISPFSSDDFTGDRSYAPIEIHLGYKPTEFVDRRLSDLYMFGSLIFHIICGSQLTPVLIQETRLIKPPHLNTTYSEILPFMRSAFGTIMDRFEKECTQKLGSELSEILKNMVSELCYPDFNQRGNLKYSNKLQRLCLEKYISKMASINKIAYIKGLN